MAVSTRQARLRRRARPRGVRASLAVFAVALALRWRRCTVSPASPGAALAMIARSRAALDDASVRKYLAGAGFTRERVTPIDDRLVRVSFFDGPRIVLEAAVAPDGRRRATRSSTGAGYVRVGGEIAQRPLVLACCCSPCSCSRPRACRCAGCRNLDVARARRLRGARSC